MLLGRMIMRRSRLNRLPVNLVVNVCCELITLNCIHKCHYFYPLLQQLSCLDNDNDNNNDDNNNNNNNSNNNNNNNNNSNNNNNNNNNSNNSNNNISLPLSLLNLLIGFLWILGPATKT